MKGKVVEKLSTLIHHKRHYAKFFHKNETVIVYPNKICVINEETKAGLNEAYKLGKKLEIGEDHLKNLLIKKKKFPKRSWVEIWNDKSIPIEEKSFLEGWTDGK